VESRPPLPVVNQHDSLRSRMTIRQFCQLNVLYCVIAGERGGAKSPRNYPPKDTSHYPGTVMLQTDQIQAGGY
jgi:hypothetical protein